MYIIACFPKFSDSQPNATRLSFCNGYAKLGTLVINITRCDKKGSMYK